MNQKLKTLGVLFLAFLVFFIGITFIEMETVLAANVADTVTIDVNVTQWASITVWPETLNWTTVSTGSAGGLQYLTIKNVGSLNVSQIYSYVDTLTTEASRPYGSGDPKSYSAGGVITLKNETDSNYYFAGRIEWNWTQDIPNHVWDVISPVAWGYFRSTNNDYVWVLGNGTAGRCNETGAQFKIESDTDLGTANERTPDVDGGTVQTGTDWGYFTISSSPLTEYCVAAYYNCSKIYIYHFDKRTNPNFGTCSNSAYLQVAILVPGYTMILTLDAWVPNGYPAGFLNTTTLTVVATSA